jgi:hypothetical protein
MKYGEEACTSMDGIHRLTIDQLQYVMTAAPGDHGALPIGWTDISLATRPGMWCEINQVGHSFSCLCPPGLQSGDGATAGYSGGGESAIGPAGVGVATGRARQAGQPIEHDSRATQASSYGWAGRKCACRQCGGP